MKKSILGITIGDPAGIGPEITLKAMLHPEVREKCLPVAIGDKTVLERAAKCLGSEYDLTEVGENADLAELRPQTIPYIDLGNMRDKDWEYGVVSPVCGEAAFQYVKYGIELALKKKIDGVVTGPINKEALNLAGHHFSGHTEIFAHFTDTPVYRMVLTGDHLRVIHVTTHVSIRNACDLITEKRVYDTVVLANETLKRLGIETPCIGVAGFNPHCSENGLFGDEEKNAISPAIERAQAEGIHVVGPVPPDTVFVKALGGEYDMVVAMYHDQGHIPLKLCGFKMDPVTKRFTNMSGVNCTVGLPIIRTSVDHGTAFDQAGKSTANEASMVEALLMAAQMAAAEVREQ